MDSRPTSVSVISWILIAMALISVVATAVSMKNPMVREMMSKSPIPLNVQFAIGFAGLGITLVSAVAMLKGQNWGRMLYVLWSAVGFSLTLITSPMKTAAIPGLIVFAVIVLFLFRPAANAYFRRA
ncbi:MAG: hypothetical protein JXR37_33825 [Kiritimatiellae bacterium]|nr:hypothetical protein [Kiritimatiellia bacterium]